MCNTEKRALKRLGARAGIAAGLWLGAAHAQAPPAAAAVNLPSPEMAGPLAFSTVPYSVDTGPLGKWYVDGVLSALGLAQSNPVQGDRAALVDLSSAQLIVQKIDGLVQFYVQAGAYSIPELGTRYAHQTEMRDALGNYYGAVSTAFLKIAPTDALSIEIGKLPTLIGDESTFSFENYNVSRGLLWNQTPGITRGVQVNDTIGPVALSVSLNDGYYSNRYNWVSGSVVWTINKADSLTALGGTNLGRTATNTIATPLAQDNSWIYDLVYTWKGSALTVSPYVQFNHVDAQPAIGLYQRAATYSGAVLADYVLTPSVQLTGRAEYIAASGNRHDTLPTNLLYGAGSAALSLTATPTYTYKKLFVRAELSIVDITAFVAGQGFGTNGNARTQFRGILQTGIIF